MASAAQLAIHLSQQGASSVERAFAGLGKSLAGLAGAPVKALGAVGGALGDVAKLAAGVAIGGGLTQLPGAMLDMARAAADDEAATARLGQALRNLGGNFDDNLGKVNAAIAAGQRLAFSDGDVRDSFQALAAATGDADEALSRQRAAMDLARGANIPLAQATKLLGKLNEDNIEVFKRLGIVIGENATEADALAAVQAKFGGQAETFARSTAGQFEQAKIAISEIQEAIGSALLPVLAAVGSALVEHLPAIQEFVGGAAATIAGLLGPALEALIPLVKDAFGSFVEFLRPVIEMLPDLATALGQALGFFATGSGDIEMFRGVLNKLIGPEGAQGVIEVFTNLTGFLHANVIPAVQAVAGAAQQAMAGDLLGALRTAGAGLVTFGQGLVTSLAEWGRRFVEWVAPMIPPLLAELRVLAQRVFDWVKAEAPGFTETLIAEWVPAAIAWVARAAVDIVPKLVAFQGTVLAWVATQAIPAFTEGALALGAAIVRGVVSGMQRLWPEVQENMISLATLAIEPARAAFDGFGNYLSTVWADLVKAVIESGPVKWLIDGIHAVRDAVQALIEAFKRLADAIRNLPKPSLPSLPSLPGASGISGSSLRMGGIAITNHIDARGMTAGQLTQAAGRDLATLARTRITAGAI